jgi:signal transduction histidine kinase
MNDTFDREHDLAELLPPALLAGIGAALRTLVGAEVAVLDPRDRLLSGRLADQTARVPLVVELEPIGYLAASAPPDRLAAAAALLRELMLARRRYLMASRLHVESVAADYAELLEKHAALQASEARYKELSAQLELRVEQQVRLLDERQRQVYQAEKLASLGRLAAGVAHEINNPIGFVRSNVATFGLYLKRLGELKVRLADAGRAWQELEMDLVLDDGDALVSESIDGIDRVARIVRDLKGFSNVDRPEEEVADLNESLRQVISVLQGQLPSGVSMQADYGELPRLLCLPGHLSQVFLNIIRNAIQAVADSGHGGVVVIASRKVEDGIDILVRDDGVGMSSEQSAHAFDPFYTTREVGQGTGLGLTVARDIVRAHGGDIGITSQPGAGTTVVVHLPT